MESPSIVLAFAAGLFTVVTPCILPILPAMLAGSSGGRLRPVAIVAGMSLTFTLMGIAVSAVGAVFAPFESALRWFSLLFIIGMGAVLYDDDINFEFVKITSNISQLIGGTVGSLVPEKLRSRPRSTGSGEEGLFGAFTLGMSLGVLWIPCVGPILGSILALVGFGGNVAHGAVLLITYSIGVSIPMLLIAYFGKSVSGRVQWFARNGHRLKKMSGAALMLVGLAMLFGIDKWLQSILLPYFPLYF
ncbi:MAG: cytochrome c biogenesis CcdA family protein [Methanosarcinaceae archaeon]|nr:cytochrome c biogenesis CcdA family protein [Methanosarcinaceae archaeon]